MPSGTTAQRRRDLCRHEGEAAADDDAGFDAVSDTDLWNIVNYLRTLAPRK